MQKFDRDEPSREKEVYITVRASDNGHPQLDDVCTIKVTIDDINDNIPVFDKVVSYHHLFLYHIGIITEKHYLMVYHLILFVLPHQVFRGNSWRVC